MVGSILGNRVRRVEDPELIDGRSTYVDDLRIPGTAHAVFVRSPLPHATITNIDTWNAEQAPGVLAVHTAETLGREFVPSFAEIHEAVGHGPLADGVVRYVGDPVALVVAETRAQAVDAAELVDVDYEPLDVVVDMEAALAPGAPQQFPVVGSNIAQS
ncbi:MAG TPA: xanthine dehydrogenase family protein molybdopterin-binding subunit, partial [Nocardioides sp.]|nr:xanthine dehydrogenase family protein molybdopterin-binding subunit [Nocardioides sp.]